MVNPEEEDPKGLLRRMMSGWNALRQNVIGDVALGLSPAGVVADLQDAARAIRERDPVGLGLAGVGFIPGVGDVAKAAGKAIRRSAAPAVDFASEAAKRGLTSSADVARNLPPGVLRSPTPGSLGVGDILSGNIASDFPVGAERVRGNVSDYAAEQYRNALESGISMDPRAVGRRRAKDFPLQGFHGTRSPRETELLIGRDLKPGMQSESPDFYNPDRRPLFAALGDEGERVASTYNIAGGDVVPLSINPGKALEVDARGNPYSGVPLSSVLDPLIRAGDLSEDDIVEALLESSPELWSDIGTDLVDDRVDYLYRAMDPEFEEAYDTFRGVTDLTSDDIARISEATGYDSSIIRRVLDTADVESGMLTMPSDVIAVNNPIGRVRHRNAVFDPRKVNLGNLFAGTAGAMIGGSALARQFNDDRNQEYY